MFTDITGSGEFTLEGSSDDDAEIAAGYFGIVCAYTSTRSDKFSFDNFKVSGDGVTDNVPPTLSGIEVASSKEIKLTFSEPLGEQSATDFNNYLIDGSQIPTEAILTDDQRTVLLLFSEPLLEKSHWIEISGIVDLHENTIQILHSALCYSTY